MLLRALSKCFATLEVAAKPIPSKPPIEPATGDGWGVAPLFLQQHRGDRRRLKRLRVGTVQQIRVVLHVSNRQLAGQKIALLHHGSVERLSRRDPTDVELPQGATHAADGLFAVRSVNNELCEKRVVV